MQIISPSSESHQQVVVLGQPLTAQPQGTVVVKTHLHIQELYLETIVTLDLNYWFHVTLAVHVANQSLRTFYNLNQLKQTAVF